MSRYIDIEPYEKDGWYLQKTYYSTYGAGVKTVPLMSVPTADAEPVKYGRWVHKYGDGHEEPAITGGECSICGYIHTATPYCPNCGAKMDEVEE